MKSFLNIVLTFFKIVYNFGKNNKNKKMKTMKNWLLWITVF
jgi:hypothetical protein